MRARSYRTKLRKRPSPCALERCKSRSGNLSREIRLLSKRMNDLLRKYLVIRLKILLKQTRSANFKLRSRSCNRKSIQSRTKKNQSLQSLMPQKMVTPSLRAKSRLWKAKSRDLKKKLSRPSRKRKPLSRLQQHRSNPKNLSFIRSKAPFPRTRMERSNKVQAVSANEPKER